MLEGLDAVEWSNYEHAYGPAEDVPALIRALASDDAETRKNARWELYGNIYHQGTVYEATQYAVPFLIELLGAPQVREKDEILKLLAQLASGSSYLDVHQDFEPERDRKDTPEFQAEVQRELGWVRAVTRAVERGMPVYVALLREDDPKVRMCAAYVLASFRGQAPLSAPVLAAALVRERDARAKASDYLSLASLLEPEHLTLFARGAAGERDELPRLAAAMAYVRLAQGQTPPEIAQLLAHAVAEADDATAAQYAELPFAQSTLQADLCGTLGWLGRSAGAFAVPVLIEALAKMPAIGPRDKPARPGENVITFTVEPAPGSEGGASLPDLSGAVTNDARTVPALMVTMTLLYLAFGDPSDYEAVTAETLTDEQRGVLHAIAQSDAAWVFNVNTHEILESYKLPREREDLRKLAAV